MSFQGLHFDNLQGGESGSFRSRGSGTFDAELGSPGSSGRSSFRKSLDTSLAREGRVRRSVEIRKRQRGVVAQAKRRKALEKSSSNGEMHPGYTADQVSQAIEDVLVPTKAALAISNLRTWLSFAPGDTFDVDLSPNGDFCVTNDVVMQLCTEKQLARRLLPILQDSENVFSEDTILDATWCITNLASGNSEQTTSTVCAANALATLVMRGRKRLQEQAAWALGNMAADDQGIREKLQELGLIPHLVVLLREPVNVSDLRIKRTAAWALCNLARGNNTSGKAFFSAAAHLALVELLENFTEVAIQSGPQSEAGLMIVEVLWTITFLSAKEPHLCIIMVHQKVLNYLVRIFTGCEGQLSICVPALRALSNLVPLRMNRPGQQTSLVVLVCQQPGFLDALQRMLADGAPARQANEALWTVANLLTLNTKPRMDSPPPEEVAVAKELVARFAKPICMYFTHYRAEHINAAATAMVNLVNRDDESILIGVLNTETEPAVLENAISFLKAPDLELVYRALDFVEMVLVRLSNPFAASRLGGRSGKQLVLDYEGIDGLEYIEMQQYPPAHSELSYRAHRLVDKFFGVDCEDEEESEAAQDGIPMPEEGTNMFRFNTDLSPPMTPASAPSAPPATAGRGRGAHLLKPAWLLAQEAAAGSQAPPGTLNQRETSQRTLQECGFGTFMDMH